MDKSRNKIDKVFFWIVLTLVFGGFFIFMSASLGLVAKNGLSLYSVVFNQVFFGIFLGIAVLIFFSKINYKKWKKYSPHILILTLILTGLVFIPKIGISHGGATRWLNLGIISIQPVELLKFGVILYLSTWYSSIGQKINTLRYGLLPLIIVIGLSGALLLFQPDTGSLLVIFVTSMSIFLIGGGRLKHIIGIVLAAILGFAIFVIRKPYILERLYTFIDPSRDPTGASWQLQQSLIAIGSGGIFGKGFGQSIQKFSFLPEPTSDSVFAVAAEEFGFLGAMVILAIFTVFLFSGLRLSQKAPDLFGRLFISGIVIMIAFQAFINIAAMIGVFPLTGIPLPFISHGGTALLVTLAEIGIILNISRHKK
jgi:cell division protein FtsW